MKLFKDYQKAKIDLISYFGHDIPTWYDVDFCDEYWSITSDREVSWGQVSMGQGTEYEYFQEDSIECVHEYVTEEYTLCTVVDSCGGEFHMIFENVKQIKDFQNEV